MNILVKILFGTDTHIYIYIKKKLRFCIVSSLHFKPFIILVNETVILYPFLLEKTRSLYQKRRYGAKEEGTEPA